MYTLLRITKPADAWGEPGARTHVPASELAAEVRGGYVSFSIKDGGLSGSADPKHDRPEAVAAISLTMDHVRTLAAFLASLPAED